MAPICFNDPNLGIVEIRIGDVMQKIDAWQVNDQIAEIQASTTDITERAKKVIDLIESLGFPKVSYKVAIGFNNAIAQAVEELEGKAERATGSPAV